MHRNDKSNFLLYIEPSIEDKLIRPIDDELIDLMELAFSKSQVGSANYSGINDEESFHMESGWSGSHQTLCGENSSNHDYLLENGMIVNSLCCFYVKWYRNSIHENDWEKLKKLSEFYNIKISIPNTFPFSKPSNKKDDNNIVNSLVDELTISINKHILDKIKKLK